MSSHDDPRESASERTPLITSSTNDGYDAVERNGRPRSDSFSSSDSNPKSKLKRRWPSLVALCFLTVLVILALVAGFVLPKTVESYVLQSATLKPKHVSVESYTAFGVNIRLQGEAVLDAGKVKRQAVRNIGRFVTSIMRKVETEPSDVTVSLPGYDGVSVGTASVPKMVIDIRNGHSNDLDILTEVRPLDPDGIRRLASDIVDGRIKEVELQGTTQIRIRSGLLNLGRQTISHAVSVPLSSGDHSGGKYNLTNIDFHKPDNTSKALFVDATLSVPNKYPLDIVAPPVGIDILVPNCLLSEEYLLLASAESEAMVIKPYQPMQVRTHGVVKELPEDLTKICPKSHSSPLDLLMRSYIQGERTIVYLRGSRSPPSDTPTWIKDLMQSVTLPVPLPVRKMDKLIRNFSLTDVHLSLPDPDAKPGSPQSKLRISAMIKALVGLPKEIKFPIDVSRVRATADVFYHEQKLGELNLQKWQKANSSLIDLPEDDLSGLLVQSLVDDAPLHVTDEDLFTEVIQSLVFKRTAVDLGVQARVDVEADLGFGKPIIRDVPAKGKITIKPILRGFGHIAPQINSLEVVDTTPDTISLRANVNVTNPTHYSASLPFLDVHIYKNGSALASVTLNNVEIRPGPNSHIIVNAKWNPAEMSGADGAEIGQRLLSQYVSGQNSTLVVKTHPGSLPTLPQLGDALSALSVEIPIPRLARGQPSDGGDEPPHFVTDATVLAPLFFPYLSAMIPSAA